MSDVKRYDAVHLRYEDSNIRYGEGCEVEVVAAYDYDALVKTHNEIETDRDIKAAKLQILAGNIVAFADNLDFDALRAAITLARGLKQ